MIIFRSSPPNSGLDPCNFVTIRSYQSCSNSRFAMSSTPTLIRREIVRVRDGFLKLRSGRWGCGVKAEVGSNK